jgi:hypothetical protein
MIGCGHWRLFAPFASASQIWADFKLAHMHTASPCVPCVALTLQLKYSRSRLRRNGVGPVIYGRLLKKAVLALAVFSAGSLRLLAAMAATADELVKQHLQSLGSADARAVKSRLVEGRALFRSLVGSSGQIEGKLVLVSEARKSHFLLKVNANDYHGEQFICDGQHTSVAGTNANKSRSDFGEFVRTQDIILREGSRRSSFHRLALARHCGEKSQP